ncbi:hypothetical protein A7982_13286 [Minicystis rosea]|nr:hypothetical protein A7982_13286 [Minicystis rosea]
MNGRAPDSYRALEHPLAQIEAAYEFYGYVDAFVKDEWEHLFVDDPPSEDDVDEAVSPFEMLGTLMGLGLRFERIAREDEIDDGYWELKYGGSELDVLIYDWAHQVMDAVNLDARAFEHGLFPTNLIFIPDKASVVREAYELYVSSMGAARKVDERVRQIERLYTKMGRSSERPSPAKRRGDGPRESNPAVVDRAALELRTAQQPLSPEEIARRIKHKNVASIAAALHQVVMYRKPKRLAGWIARDDDGRYRWTA